MRKIDSKNKVLYPNKPKNLKREMTQLRTILMANYFLLTPVFRHRYFDSICCITQLFSASQCRVEYFCSHHPPCAGTLLCQLCLPTFFIRLFLDGPAATVFWDDRMKPASQSHGTLTSCSCSQVPENPVGYVKRGSICSYTYSTAS